MSPRTNDPTAERFERVTIIDPPMNRLGFLHPVVAACALLWCSTGRLGTAETPASAESTTVAAPSQSLASPATGSSTPDRGAGVDDAVVTTFRERNGGLFEGWSKPQAMVVVTGELDGYIEPCGCTGKENQKGGLSRRRNFLRALTAADWPLVSVDLGGQVKRFGRQSEIKFQSIADGLRTMGYSAVGFGPGDLRLPAEELVAAVAPVGDRPTPFVSANVGLLGLDANITPRFRIVEAGGLRFGIVSVLGDAEAKQVRNDAIEIVSAVQGIEAAAAELKKANCTHQILLSWASPEETKSLAARFPQFDIVATAGGADAKRRPSDRTWPQGHVRGGNRVLRRSPEAAPVAAGATRCPLGRSGGHDHAAWNLPEPARITGTHRIGTCRRAAPDRPTVRGQCLLCRLPSACV